MTRPHAAGDAAFRRASAVLAGGVSSDARRIPGSTPLFVARADGSRLVDLDGNDYLDYVLGQGSDLLGHCAEPIVQAVAEQAGRAMSLAAQTELEVEVAELLVEMVPAAQLVRFNTVGSEAVHGAMRLARGVTGRPKIVKFEGHYHGWFDPVLVSVHPDPGLAGDPARPTAVRGSAGIPDSMLQDLVVLPWNDLKAVQDTLARLGDQIAAVITEPIMCNSGAIMPDAGYLPGLRELCTSNGSVLIFDEVITGFRVAPGGAQQLLGVTPDLAVLGKALSAGMLASAIVGSEEIMSAIADGRVGHAGTFNSHPVSMAAARAALSTIRQDPRMHQRITDLGRRLMAGLREAAAAAGVPITVDGPGPVFQTYLGVTGPIRNYRDFAAADARAMARLHALLLRRGINVVPRGLWFLSAAHTEQDVDATIEAAGEAFAELSAEWASR